MSGPIVPSGIRVPPIEPGSPEWLAKMSASKIATVLGVSPFESPLSLYYQMTGEVVKPQTKAMARGHYLEPAILAWFADQRPDLTVTTEKASWVHSDREWQMAAPDGLAVDADGNVECVEAKSAGDMEGWGPDGSDEIPVYYRPQVQWQLDTLGLQVCHVAAILPFLQFRSYLIRYDEEEAGRLRIAGREFLERVERRDPPPADGHRATYEAVRQLYPLVESTSVEVGADLAELYLDAVVAANEAQAQKRFASALLADCMGDAQEAYCEGRVIARRQSKNGELPYLCVARGATKERAA